jgi:hypothetical protein
MADGSLEPILTGVPKLGTHTWARDGSFLIYEVSEEAEKDIEGVKRHRSLADRGPVRTFLLYRLCPGGPAEADGGELSTRMEDISPDNGRPRIADDFDPRSGPIRRPSFQSSTSNPGRQGHLERSWLNSAQGLQTERAPDAGRPVAFAGLGVQVRKGRSPEADVQAYV